MLPSRQNVTQMIVTLQKSVTSRRASVGNYPKMIFIEPELNPSMDLIRMEKELLITSLEPSEQNRVRNHLTGSGMLKIDYPDNRDYRVKKLTGAFCDIQSNLS